jgi:hypothetical protein
MGAGVLAHGEAPQEVVVSLDLGYGLELHARVPRPLGNAGMDRPTKVNDSGE